MAFIPKGRGKTLNAQVRAHLGEVLRRLATEKESRIEEAWLVANRWRLGLFPLPPYSPESNPIEGVWKQTKERATHNTFFRTTDERDAALTATFEWFRAHPARIGNQVPRLV